MCVGMAPGRALLCLGLSVRRKQQQQTFDTDERRTGSHQLWCTDITWGDSTLGRQWVRMAPTNSLCISFPLLSVPHDGPFYTKQSLHNTAHLDSRQNGTSLETERSMHHNTRPPRDGISPDLRTIRRLRRFSTNSI